MSFPRDALRHFDGLSSTLGRKDLYNFDNLGYNVQILIIVLFLSQVNLFGSLSEFFLEIIRIMFPRRFKRLNISIVSGYFFHVLGHLNLLKLNATIDMFRKIEL
jgi:hypothetical protein